MQKLSLRDANTTGGEVGLRKQRLTSRQMRVKSKPLRRFSLPDRRASVRQPPKEIFSLSCKICPPPPV